MLRSALDDEDEVPVGAVLEEDAAFSLMVIGPGPEPMRRKRVV